VCFFSSIGNDPNCFFFFFQRGGSTTNQKKIRFIFFLKIGFPNGQEASTDVPTQQLLQVYCAQGGIETRKASERNPTRIVMSDELHFYLNNGVVITFFLLSFNF